MYRSELTEAAALQLSYDYSCNPHDFFGSVSRVTPSALNSRRREITDGPDFFRMAVMGGAAVATADSAIMPSIQKIMQLYSGAQLFTGKVQYLINQELSRFNRTIGDITVYYLPATPYKYYHDHGFNVRVYEQTDIVNVLYRYRGFSNALLYSTEKKRRDVLAVCALNGDEIIGMAGASSDSEKFWQIGIDVLPQYRGLGVAAEIVSALTHQVFMHGAIPYYGTWSGNIASQNVARKCGYFPVWTEMFANSIE